MSDDEDLIETMARIIAGDTWPLKIDFDLAEECLDVCRPVVQAQERERILQELPAQSAIRKLEEQNQEIGKLEEQILRLKSENERLKEDLIALVGFVPTRMVFDGEKFTPEQ